MTKLVPATLASFKTFQSGLFTKLQHRIELPKLGLKDLVLRAITS